jgi:hypothetical protein
LSGIGQHILEGAHQQFDRGVGKVGKHPPPRGAIEHRILEFAQLVPDIDGLKNLQNGVQVPAHAMQVRIRQATAGGQSKSQAGRPLLEI